MRVYQDGNDTSQTVGCDTAEYPTKTWIEAYQHRYKNRDDQHPLKPIVQGGRHCKADSHCGEGTCSNGRCRCSKGWVGPRCLVPHYKNDFEEELEELELDAMFVPPFLAWAAFLLVASMAAAIGAVVVRRRRPGTREFRHPLLS